MGLLRWIGGLIVLIWLIGFIFKFGGNLIHLLLIVAVVLFIADKVFGKRL